MALKTLQTALAELRYSFPGSDQTVLWQPAFELTVSSATT